ncbi:MAG: hypothetical protein R2710_27140 [Acidimicrobiales bacterium]
MPSAFSVADVYGAATGPAPMSIVGLAPEGEQGQVRRSAGGEVAERARMPLGSVE